MGNLNCEREVRDGDGRRREFENSTPALSDLVGVSSIRTGARHHDLYCF